MAVALLTAFTFIFVAMHDDLVRLLIVGGGTVLMLVIAYHSGCNGMQRALRDNDLEITDAGINIPVQRGIAHIPYDSIRKIELEELATAGPAARLHVKGFPKTRIVGYDNMSDLLHELLKHIPPERVDTKRIRTPA